MVRVMGKEGAFRGGGVNVVLRKIEFRKIESRNYVLMRKMERLVIDPTSDEMRWRKNQSERPRLYVGIAVVSCFV